MWWVSLTVQANSYPCVAVCLKSPSTRPNTTSRGKKKTLSVFPFRSKFHNFRADLYSLAVVKLDFLPFSLPGAWKFLFYSLIFNHFSASDTSCMIFRSVSLLVYGNFNFDFGFAVTRLKILMNSIHFGFFYYYYYGLFWFEFVIL